MSAREWKPGDVAMVGAGIGFMVEGGAWYHADESWTPSDTRVEIRPLAVIDPDSPDDQRRLLSLLRKSGAFRGVVSQDIALDCIGDALREFANPTPPKPPEPTGLGAVVKDAEGGRWVRQCSPGYLNDPNWRLALGHGSEWRLYADINAVKVLSEGVES